MLIRQALQGEPVRRFMNGEPIVVPPSLDLLRWVEDFVYHYHHKAFPVVSDGHLEGCINTQALAGIPRGQWDQHTVGEVMRHDLQTIAIPPDADALDALGRMRRTGSSRLLVVERGRLIGMVSLKDLLHFLSLKIELEGAEPSGSELDGEFRLPEQLGRRTASEPFPHHGGNGRKYA